MGRDRSLLLAFADLRHFHFSLGTKCFRLLNQLNDFEPSNFMPQLTADYTRQMTRFYIIGYLVPGVLILIWAAIKTANGDNKQCWHSDNVVDSVELIWKGPRLGMNMFNFTIFASTLKALISITGLTSMTLFTRPRSIQTPAFNKIGSDSINLAKATLSLIPLFGLHEIIDVQRTLTSVDSGEQETQAAYLNLMTLNFLSQLSNVGHIQSELFI